MRNVLHSKSPSWEDNHHQDQLAYYRHYTHNRRAIHAGHHNVVQTVATWAHYIKCSAAFLHMSTSVAHSGTLIDLHMWCERLHTLLEELTQQHEPTIQTWDSLQAAKLPPDSLLNIPKMRQTNSWASSSTDMKETCCNHMTTSFQNGERNFIFV